MPTEGKDQHEWKVGDRVKLTDLPRGQMHEGEVTHVEPGLIHVTAGLKTWAVRHPYHFVSREVLVIEDKDIKDTTPSPTFWPGEVTGGVPGHTDREEIGPIGAGTPHARMQWFWERMRPHEKLIEELTGWSPLSSTYRFEAAVADAFDKLAEERDRVG